MKKSSILCLIVILILSGCIQLPVRKEKSFAFTHVTVIDATGGAAKPDYTVLISGNKIVAVGKDITLPTATVVIDAHNKYLIPGLWDMHAHPFLAQTRFPPQLVLNLYIANGVTGLRDMFGPLEAVQQWRKDIAAGKALCPAIWAAGPLLDGPRPAWPGAIGVADAAQARSAVISLKTSGVDFIKVYDLLPREAYFAIAEEAKKEQLPFAGHVPTSITMWEASDAGQKSIEHFTGLLEACSEKETTLQQQAMATNSIEDNAIAVKELLRLAKAGLESYKVEKCQQLFAKFVKNGTWYDPTMVAYSIDSGNYDLQDVRLKYIPSAIEQEWQPENSAIFKAFTAQDFADAKIVFQKYMELVGLMHRAGVEFLAGTDAPMVSFCFPGFSLHDELRLFVQAGFTPLEALQTATRNPAQYLGVIDSLGTIEKGKIANLVLLTANPLEDIGNTRKIEAVVLEGRLIDSSARESLLKR